MNKKRIATETSFSHIVPEVSGCISAGETPFFD